MIIAKVLLLFLSFIFLSYQRIFTILRQKSFLYLLIYDALIEMILHTWCLPNLQPQCLHNSHDLSPYCLWNTKCASLSKEVPVILAVDMIICTKSLRGIFLTRFDMPMTSLKLLIPLFIKEMSSSFLIHFLVKCFPAFIRTLVPSFQSCMVL